MCAAQTCTDGLEGHFGVFLCKIHHHLAGIRDFSFTRFSEDLICLNVVERADLTGDGLEVDGALVEFHRVGEHTARKFDRDILVKEGGMGQKRNNHTFKLTDALSDIRCDEIHHLSWERESIAE